MFKHILFSLMIGYMLTSCASVEFYSNKNLDNKTGLKVFTNEPYLLLTNPRSDSSSVSIVYLPDIENPIYIKSKKGLGSAKFNLTVENGSLTSFGNEIDSKISETVSSSASVIESIGGLLSLTQSDDQQNSLNTLPASFILYKLITVEGQPKLQRVSLYNQSK